MSYIAYAIFVYAKGRRDTFVAQSNSRKKARKFVAEQNKKNMDLHKGKRHSDIPLYYCVRMKRGGE